jgi:hypothetical protein
MEFESKANRLHWLPQWQRDIITRYPSLYLEPPRSNLKDYEQSPGQLPEDHCNLRYGFECQAGWAPLIDELSATGTALVNVLQSFGFQDDARIWAFIVKEKFGVLCWQGHDNLLPPFHSLWRGYIAWIRERSSHTCEESGQLGELRKIGSRFQTLSKVEFEKALIRIKDQGRKERDP